MNYVLCGAYKGLLFALYIKNILKEEITIITHNKDIVDYCKMENIKYIQFEFSKLKVSSLYKLFSHKKILDKIITNLDVKKNDNIFLLSHIKGYDFFYITKKLAKKYNAYYKIADQDFSIYKPSKYKPFNIRGGLIRTCLKLVMGLDLIYYRTDPKSPCLGIDEKILKKYEIKEYAPDANIEDLISEVVKKNKLRFKEYDNLIIDQGSVFIHVKIESIKNFYKKLFELPVEFAFKKHPNPGKEMKDYYDLFKNCEKIPRYIPVELFYNNIRNNVISLYSTALISASKISHLNVISLLELVEWYDESYKNHWKNFLKKMSNDSIIFPTNYDELKEVMMQKCIV